MDDLDVLVLLDKMDDLDIPDIIPQHRLGQRLDETCCCKLACDFLLARRCRGRKLLTLRGRAFWRESAPNGPDPCFHCSDVEHFFAEMT